MTRNHPTAVVLVSSLLVMLSGCERSVLDSPQTLPEVVLSQPASPAGSLAPESVVQRLLLPYPDAYTKGRTWQEVARRDHSAAIRALGAASASLRGASPSEMHAIAYNAIAAAPPDVRWALENVFAQYILDVLHSRRLARDHRDLVEQYTLHLLATQSQRADLIAPSLDILATKWPAERIRAAAREALVHTENWIAAVQSSQSRIRDADPATAAIARVPNAVRAATNDLRTQAR